MAEQNKNNNNRNIVGIAGLNMNNSSITETSISSSNPEGGNVGIFDTVMKDSNFSKLNISDILQLSQNDKEVLKSYGIVDTEINDLNEIIVQNKDDKPSLQSKVMKWLGSVSASVAAKGFSDNIPYIVDFVQKIIQ